MAGVPSAPGNKHIIDQSVDTLTSDLPHQTWRLKVAPHLTVHREKTRSVKTHDPFTASGAEVHAPVLLLHPPDLQSDGLRLLLPPAAAHVADVAE